MNTFSEAVKARCEYALAGLSVRLGLDKIAEDHADLAYGLAYDAGRKAHKTGAQVSLLLAEEGALLKAWESGRSDAATDEAIARHFDL